jgi:hypothetical protein
MEYESFLRSKRHVASEGGFEPLWMPDCLFGFQSALTSWAIRKGRAATFATPGMGKTLMQLVWGQNVVQHTNRPALLLAPIAVCAQTLREAAKFGVDAVRSSGGSHDKATIVITNYEKLHLFDRNDFSAVICDESGCLKNVDAKTRDAVIDFMRPIPYRSLYTATAAPNDYVELGNSSEALGEMGFQDMVSKFFKKENAGGNGWARLKYRLRGHATVDFWRWVCSWARALRKPSDLGFPDGDFILPPLETYEHTVMATTPREGLLFDMPAVTLQEQQEERRRTIPERCQMAAELVEAHDGPSIAWCHLNDEGDELERLIPNCVQVSGRLRDEQKEEAFDAFCAGQVDTLVCKPEIAAWGLNFQHCAHQTFFPSHSFEQFYQAKHRSHRFGQKRTVRIDVVTSEGQQGVLANLNRKAEQADHMFAQLVALMNDPNVILSDKSYIQPEVVPSWLA